MSNSLILAISGTSIRQDSNGRFCLNDLHKASGNNKKHQPANWLRLDQAKDLIEELNASANLQTPSSEMRTAIEVINGGSNPGTYAVKELVYAYAMWISAKFHIAVIRAYDSMVTSKQPELKALPPVVDKLSPAQQCHVQTRIKELVKTQTGTTYGAMYGQIKRHFNIGTYKDLPASRYPELCKFLNCEPLAENLSTGLITMTLAELQAHDAELVKSVQGEIVEKQEPVTTKSDAQSIIDYVDELFAKKNIRLVDMNENIVISKEKLKNARLEDVFKLLAA